MTVSGSVDVIEQRCDGRGFAGARRPRHEHDALRRIEHRANVGRQPELFERQRLERQAPYRDHGLAAAGAAVDVAAQPAAREHERAIDGALRESRFPLLVDGLEHRAHLFHHHGRAIAGLDPALRRLDHDRAILLDMDIGEGLGQIDERENFAREVAQPAGFNGHVGGSVKRCNDDAFVTLKNRHGGSKAERAYAPRACAGSVHRTGSWDGVGPCAAR